MLKQTSIDAFEDDLERTIQSFEKHHSEEPFETYLLLPSPALRDMVRERVVSEGLTLVDSSVSTPESFCRRVVETCDPDFLVASDVTVRLILHAILEGNRERLPIVMADRPTTAILSSLIPFIESIHDFMVDYPSCLGELRGRKAEELGFIIREYRNTLLSKGLLDSRMAMERCVELLRGREAPRLGTVIFFGMFEPNPLQRELFRVICQRAGRVDYRIPWYASEKVFRDRGGWLSFHADLIDFSRRDQALLSIFEVGTKRDVGGVKAAKFRSPLEEMRAVAQEIYNLIIRGVRPSEIAILLPMREKSAPLVREVLDEFGIPHQVNVKVPLCQVPLIQSALSLLEVPVSGYARGKVVEAVSSPYIRFWYDAGDGRRQLGAELDLLSREAGIVEGFHSWRSGFDGLVERYREEISRPGTPDWERESLSRRIRRIEEVASGVDVLLNEFKSIEGRYPLHSWPGRVRGLLERVGFKNDVETGGWRGGEDSSALPRLLSILDDIEGTSRSLSLSMGINDFARLLRQILSSEGVFPDGEAEGVRISGLRSNPFLSHEHLFIIGLVEGDIPRVSLDYFLADKSERKQMGLLPERDILRHERYYFLMALLSGRNVYLSHPETEGDTKVVSSSFYDTVIDTLDPTSFGGVDPHASLLCSQRILGESIATGDVPGSEIHPLTIGLGEVCRRMNVEAFHRNGSYDSPYDGVLQAEDILCRLRDRFGESRSYSASMIDQYASCPFAFFMKYVLRLEPFPEPDTGITPLESGGLIHRILCDYHRDRKGRGLAALQPYEVEVEVERIGRIAGGALSSYNYSGPSWESYRARLLGVPGGRKGLLEAFIEHELENSLRPLRPEYLELSIGGRRRGDEDPASLDGPAWLSDKDNRGFHLRCRMDRVDVDDGGRFVVLDYKTGRAPSLKDIREGRALQLPLYIRAMEAVLPDSKGIGGAYYLVKNEWSVGYEGVVADSGYGDMLTNLGPKGLIDDFVTVLDNSMDRAIGCIESMREGVFHPNLDGRCPIYCDFSHVCRFSDLRIEEREEDNGTDE